MIMIKVYTYRCSKLLMKIIRHNSEQEKTVDGSIKDELNKELKAVLPNDTANPIPVSI
jgi:hypothetical protein